MINPSGLKATWVIIYNISTIYFTHSDNGVSTRHLPANASSPEVDRRDLFVFGDTGQRE